MIFLKSDSLGSEKKEAGGGRTINRGGCIETKVSSHLIFKSRRVIMTKLSSEAHQAQHCPLHLGSIMDFLLNDLAAPCPTILLSSQSRDYQMLDHNTAWVLTLVCVVQSFQN